MTDKFDKEYISSKQIAHERITNQRSTSSPTGVPVNSFIRSELITSASDVKLKDDFRLGLKISDGEGGRESESTRSAEEDEMGKGMDVGWGSPRAGVDDVEMKEWNGFSAAKSAASLARMSGLIGVAGGEFPGVPMLENEYDDAPLPGLASLGCCAANPGRTPVPPTSDPGERGGLGELLRAR